MLGQSLSFEYINIWLFVFSSIINSFEGIIDALINQENFTNITVVEDDIALLGQRVSLLLCAWGLTQLKL